MTHDDIPEFLIISPEARKASWDAYRSTHLESKENPLTETKKLYDAQRVNDNTKKMERVRAKGALKKMKKEQSLNDRAAVAKGKRWNSMKAKWE
jgi:hypothetical protein